MRSRAKAAAATANTVTSRTAPPAFALPPLAALRGVTMLYCAAHYGDGCRLRRRVRAKELTLSTFNRLAFLLTVHISDPSLGSRPINDEEGSN